MTTTAPKTLTIGKVAKQSGFSIDTIRFYEREGLLPEPERKPSGYRIYYPSIFIRLRFIKRAKQLGFSLEEITELLSLSEDNHDGVKGVRERAQHHVDLISQRIATLIKVRDSLSQLVDACPGHGAPEECPILRALTDEETPLAESTASE